MLHNMARDGHLASRETRKGRSVRKLYSISDKGRGALGRGQGNASENLPEAKKR